MHSGETNPASGQYVQQVARKFVALYYRVLNNYAGYLFQFYGADSTVVVCEVKENGHPMTTKAENMTTVQELLRSLYEDVTITVRNCTPQPSSGGCISLLITGLMTRKQYSEDRAFTQALILSRQSDGYYIKTDTVLVFPRAKCMSGPSSLLSSPLTSSRTTDKVVEMGEDISLHGPVTEQTSQPAKMGIEVSHTRIPSIDVKNGTPLIGSSQGYQQAINGPIDRTTSMKESKDNFTFNIPARETIAVQSIPFMPTDFNRQGGLMMSDTNGSTPMYSGFINPMTSVTNRFSSPLSAPGALASHMTAEGLIADFGRLRSAPWSHKSSPRNCAADAAQRASNGLHKLFACKLPLGITADIVTNVFSQYGKLAEEDPIRVFTGQNNCYACVSYATEQDAQKAIDAEIRIGDALIVTDAWRPRERRPKRRRPDNTQDQKAAIGTAN